VLSENQYQQVIQAFSTLDVHAQEELVEDFFTRVLALNPMERLAAFPSPDPQGIVDISISRLTEHQEQALTTECRIPAGVVFRTAAGSWVVSGLASYLQVVGADQKLIERIQHHDSVRTEVLGYKQGHHLEAVAASILESMCGYGEATRGSGDQGIDAVGRKVVVESNSIFDRGHVDLTRVPNHSPGRHIFLLASSKASQAGLNKPLPVLNPAHLRELVGGWLIQRDSAVGKWQNLGIQMLTPLQMVLVTTYRMSAQSEAECKKLGILVWGVPQLIALICTTAPNDVFDTTQGHTFVPAAFKKWWKRKHSARLKAKP
jgi:hypothetical protein